VSFYLESDNSLFTLAYAFFAERERAYDSERLCGAQGVTTAVLKRLAPNGVALDTRVQVSSDGPLCKPGVRVVATVFRVAVPLGARGHDDDGLELSLDPRRVTRVVSIRVAVKVVPLGRALYVAELDRFGGVLGPPLGEEGDLYPDPAVAVDDVVVLGDALVLPHRGPHLDARHLSAKGPGILLSIGEKVHIVQRNARVPRAQQVVELCNAGVVGVLQRVCVERLVHLGRGQRRKALLLAALVAPGRLNVCPRRGIHAFLKETEEATLSTCGSWAHLGYLRAQVRIEKSDTKNNCPKNSFFFVFILDRFLLLPRGPFSPLPGPGPAAQRSSFATRIVRFPFV